MDLKKNILLVDDDSIAIFLIEKVVTSTGLVNQIFKALNGQEALSIFQQFVNHSIALPEIVLLDLNMPIMDGFEFLQEFEKMEFKEKAKVRIVIVSSSNNPIDIEKAKSLGAKYYLTKPISAENVKSIILNGFV